MGRIALLAVTLGTVAATLAGSTASRAAPVAGPSPLLPFCTYLGGEGFDSAAAAAFGEDGALWIAAESSSKALRGAVRSGKVHRDDDVVVLRMDPTTHEVLSSAWIGSDKRDHVVALTPARGGGAFVLGTVTGDRFPSTTDWRIHPHASRHSAFLARVRADGSAFEWSVVFDPSVLEGGAALALTLEGDPLVVGGGSGGAAIVRVAADGSRVVFSRTFADWTSLTAVAVEPDGEILVAGTADPWGLDAPTRLRPAASYIEGFLAELNGSGTRVLRFATLGTAIVDSVAVAGDGVLLLAGTEQFWLPTKAPDAPDTPGGVLFLRLDADWKIAAARPLGGSGDERSLSMTTSPDGKVWVTGSTTSTDLAVFHPVQPVLGSKQDAFVAAFDPADLEPLFFTYLGGDGNDAGQTLAVAPDGAAWLVGSTKSSDLPLADADQTAPASETDLFVARLVSDALQGSPPLAPVGFAADVAGPHEVRLRWSVDAGDAEDVVVFRREAPGAFVRAAVVPATTTEWTDATVRPLRRYAYAVQALSVLGGSTAPTVEIRTPASSQLRVVSATVDFARVTAEVIDVRLHLKGVLSATSGPGGSRLDPRRDGVEWTLTGAAGESAAVFSIPPGDTHWRTSRHGLRWIRRGTRVEFDPASGAFDLRTSQGMTVIRPQRTGDEIRVSSGDEAGAADVVWRLGGPTRIQAQ